MTALLTTAAAISTPGGRDRDPPLLQTSSVDREGVARVIAKVIVGGRSHVNCDGFVHHSCRRSWTPLLINIAALLTCIFLWTTTQENPETLLMYNILFSFSRALFNFAFGFF